MRKISIACIIVTMIVLQSADSPGNDWGKPAIQKDGITVHIRSVEGMPIREFRGTASINAPVKILFTVIMDVSSYCTWKEGSCYPAEIIRKNSNLDLLIYSRTKIPLAAPRDSVMRVQVSMSRDKKKITLQMTSLDLESSIRIVPLNPDYVRMPYYRGLWILENRGNDITTVTYEGSFDPGGSIPAWVINAALEKIPYKTIRDLKKAVHMDRYRKLAEEAGPL